MRNPSAMSNSALVHGVAGVVGGSAAMLLTYPLLTITIRQQTAVDNKASKSQVSLYNGVLPTTFGVAYSMGIYFYAYEHLKTTLETLKKGRMNTLENLVVGFVAGTVNTTLSCPIWRITTVMQAERSKKETLQQIATKLFKEGGLVTFWRGWVASIILCINPAIQSMVYEQLSRVYVNILKKKQTSFSIFLLGAIAKIVATLITFPYIVVKSRIQGDV